MTRSPAWHVRVEHEGTVHGSGFLVGGSTVLTCAHVVHGLERASVSFPGVPGLGALPSRVGERGLWAGGRTDPGDVAVLTLEAPAPAEPAVFAAPFADPDVTLGDGGPPRLVAYGFPHGYTEEGAQSELRVTHDRQLISGEWNQVEFWKGYGQEPSHGFSGSAAMRADSGAVVGMISSYDPVSRNGRMIPARVLARHVPGLAELVPTPGYSAEEKRWLRELVNRVGAPPCPVERLLSTATGRLGPTVPPAWLGGLWQGVWYLFSEVPPHRGRLPLAELTLRLADLVPDRELGRELRAWSREHRSRHETGPASHVVPASPAGVTSTGGPASWGTPAPGPAPGADACDDGRGDERADGCHDRVPDGVRDRDGAGARYDETPAAALPWAPILVEIRRSGADRNAVMAEVSVYRDGDRLLVNEKRLTTAQLRSWVLDRIDDAHDEIGDGRPLIAFALPRDWLNRPVDLWTRSKGKEAPLGCTSPVVVMDHDRRGKARLQFQLKRAWAELDRQDGSPLHRVACSSTHRPPQLSVLLQDVRGPVGFTRPPKTARDRELHGAALNAPAPILLWPRTGCPPGGPCAGACPGAGFLDRMAERISLLPPGELPDLVFRLRKEAFLHEGPEPHWAAELSLVWEDPRRFPEVRPLRRSPVA